MLFKPTINPTTKTLDIINQIVAEVQSGERSFVLGRYVIVWTDGKGWEVREQGTHKILLNVDGLVFGIGLIVTCWINNDWDI